MELRDLIVTPIIIFLVYAGAYWIRPRVTDSVNRKYFIPALTVRIIGALAVGFLYQFYYDGGDTFNFHTHGSRHMWEAFMDSPIIGLKMMLSDGTHEGSFYEYSSRIPFFSDSSSYFVIRLAALFDLFTFSSYLATALFFATLSFIGMWMLFISFYRRYPESHFALAVSCFFIPSVFFWGSGLLKDTLMLACLGALTFEVDRLFLQRKFSFWHLVLLVISLWCIFSVKKFILQAFLPALFVWVYMVRFSKIRSVLARIMILPAFLLIFFISGYYAIVKVGEGDKRYAVENLAKTAKITAYDIRYQTGRDAGSGYALGDLDGTFSSMLKLAPLAVNVSLFRPYLWEVRSPLMLFSSMESFILLCIIVWLLLKNGFGVLKHLGNPDVIFCLSFTLIFAFAVGISSYNFGTLSRYRIPLLPFLGIAITAIIYENKLKKIRRLDSTE